MTLLRLAALAAAFILPAGLASPIAAQAPAPVVAEAPLPAFPGALGWAAQTPGGRGGLIIRVTNLDAAGPGSLRAAIEADGPRIVVFEVGGVIDLGRQTLRLRNPFITIAGQTAPSPGITLIRGGMDISAHDVIVQHIRIRPGSAGGEWMSGWDEDGIATVGGYNVIIDHCSLTWATDENLSASGPRFTGTTPEEWRRGTSHNITFSNNLNGESLAYSTHSKGEHSKGSLIHDNVTGLLIVGNLYAHNYERSPLFKGGVHGVIVNNLIYNPGPRAIHYNLAPEEWGTVPFEVGKMTVIGNVLRAGPSTPVEHLAFMMIGGAGDVEYYGRDNIAVDQVGEPIRMFGRYTTAPARIIQTRRPPAAGLVGRPDAHARRTGAGRGAVAGRRPPVGPRHARRAADRRGGRGARRNHRPRARGRRLSDRGRGDAQALQFRRLGPALHDPSARRGSGSPGPAARNLTADSARCSV